MATYGGRDIIRAVARSDFRKKNTNMKAIVSNNSFKMFAINLKLY